MKYCIAKKLPALFGDAVVLVRDALKQEGFGVLTEIDVKAILKKKLNVEFRDYLILGTCNPPFAHRALNAEDKIGTMLPCNVIIQAVDSETVEVAAIDPTALMQAVENPGLAEVAEQVSTKLRAVIDGLSSGG